MRRLSFFLALAVALPGSAESLSQSLPDGVPDGRALGWERVTGEIETSAERVNYEFYVNPARGAIYETVRYLVAPLPAAGQPPTEKLIWNARPGMGEKPHCFVLELRRWRTLETGTPEYGAEMGTAIHVFGPHRRARLAERE